MAEFDREMQKDIQSAVFKAVSETGDTGEAIEAAVKAALGELERYRDILGVVLSRLGYHVPPTGGKRQSSRTARWS